MSHSLSRSMSRLSLTANPTTTLKRTAQSSNKSSIRSRSSSAFPSSSSSTSSSSLFISSTSRNLIPRSNHNLQIHSRSYASHAPATLTLGNLKPAQPSKNRKRLGRGPSSGRGGTATRGHKGQKARRGNGKPTPGFEGGQTPIMRRYPKRGFTNIHSKTYVPLNLDRLQHWIDRGLIDPSQPITTKELLDSRCIHSVKDGVKILGDGSKHLSQPISILVSKASTSAIQAIESLGGSITCRYYTPLTLRALTKPHKWTDLGRIVPRGSDPTGKRDLLYYSDPRKRGYLAKRSAIIKAQQAQEEASKVVEASEEK